MSYVDSVLLPGERVVVLARKHWFIYAMPAAWAFAAFVVAALSKAWSVSFLDLAGFIGFISSALFVRAWITATTTELAVTTRRIIAKVGFIRRNTVELRSDYIESMRVDQGILGRIFDYGDIVLTGSGGTNAPITHIAAPLRFRGAAIGGIENIGD